MLLRLAYTSALLGSFLFVHSACREEKDFGGDVKVAERKSAGTESTSGDATQGRSVSLPVDPGMGQVTQPAPVGCDANTVGVTQSKLLSTALSRSLMTQTLRYELQALSCADGSAISLKDQVLYFDLNALVTPGFVNVGYKVSDAASGTLVHTGTLQVISGRDLFGNQGSYAHWKTDSLSYTSNFTSLILEIQLQNIQIAPPNPANTSIDSYLKVGQSKPVTQAIALTN